MLALLGTFLLSLFVAVLAALQLADYFQNGGEFDFVLIAVAAFAVASMAILAVVSSKAKRLPILNAAAAGLAMLAVALTVLSPLADRIADHSANPHTVGIENKWLRIELVIPMLIAVLIQWGLVRQRWLRLRAAEELSRWPWVTTVIAGLVVLNPVGLAFIGAAIAYSPTDWLRDLSLAIATVGGAVLIAMAGIEYYIRGRMLRRRMGPNTASMREAGPATPST